MTNITVTENQTVRISVQALDQAGNPVFLLEDMTITVTPSEPASFSLMLALTIPKQKEVKTTKRIVRLED